MTLITQDNLKQFTKQELIDVILRFNGTFMSRSVEYIIETKMNEKLENDLSYLDKELAKAAREKEDYISMLKLTYNTQDEKELLSKINIDERIKIIQLISKCSDIRINNSKKEDKIYKEHFKKKGQEW